LKIEDQDQRFILEEVLRYLSHESVGVSRFDRMNSEWKDLVSKVQSGAPLSKTDPVVEQSVAAWVQVSRNISLLMTQKIGTQVRLVLSRAQAEDAAVRLKEDCEFLVSDHQLQCALDVPDSAAPIRIFADLQRRSLSISMEVVAPKDKQRSSSRINWLVRQLGKADPSEMHIRARWPGRAGVTQAELKEARESTVPLERGREGLIPTSFEVVLVRDLGAKFSGAKNFIEGLEEAVPYFYEQVGQHLRAYVATPPKIKDDTKSESATAAEVAEGKSSVVESVLAAVGSVDAKQPVPVPAGEEESAQQA
jgi:hypothetical protein